MPSEDFIKSLRRRGLYKEFKRTLDDRQRNYRREHKDELDEIRRRKQDGIEKDRRHRRVLNLCIYPFYNTTSPPFQRGYHFVRANPLEELGIKNVDFLIYNFSLKRPVAIFGEAKGSINSPARVVRETKNRIQVIMEREDYIKSSYLQLNPATQVHFEYVLGVPVEDNLRICEMIERVGGGLIPWSVGGLEENLLSLKIPRNIDEAVRKSMKHLDEELNKSLDGLKSHDNCFSLFPNSHEVTKLEILVETSTDMVVDTAELKKKLYSYLFYLNQTRIDTTVEEILRKGTSLRIIERIDSRRYRLKSIWKKMEMISRDVREKWMEDSIEREFLGKLEEIEKDVVKEFKKELERQKTLEAFRNN